MKTFLVKILFFLILINNSLLKAEVNFKVKTAINPNNILTYSQFAGRDDLFLSIGGGDFPRHRSESSKQSINHTSSSSISQKRRAKSN